MGAHAFAALLHAANLFTYSYDRHEIVVGKECEAIAFAQERDKQSERYRKSVTKIAEKLRALEASLVEQKASRDKKGGTTDQGNR